MRNKKFGLQLGSLFVLLAVMFTACKKTEFDPNFELPRQFKPGDINIAAGEIQATLSWSPSLFTQGTSYTVEVSKDTTFQTPSPIIKVVDTAWVTITDDELEINQKYFARVKANTLNNTAESGWVYSESFMITGEQIFFDVLDAELKDNSVILRWRPTAGLTKIVLTPTVGTPVEIPLTATDVDNEFKLIEDLDELTEYSAEVFRGTVSKGFVSFTTKEKSIYVVILNPGDDIIEAVNNAASGEIIGLNPGTYDLKDGSGAYANLVISQKHIGLESVTLDPTSTKVNFKEIKLNGTGAGITFKGIEFDGTAAGADYFINLTGLNSDGEAAEFTSITVDNCIVHKTNNAFMRGNRGSANAHKIDFIKVNNTLAYENGTGSYHYFMIDKLEFKTLELTNNTFYDIARAFISWATNMTMPAVPQIIINQNTINNYGFSGRNNILIDANANNINATIQNNIIANTPKPGQAIGSSALRAGDNSVVTFSYNNTFNFNGGDPLAPLTFPSIVQQSNNLNIDLGWTATTTDFTLPAGSPLRTAGNTGGPIGDPRWAF